MAGLFFTVIWSVPRGLLVVFDKQRIFIVAIPLLLLLGSLMLFDRIDGRMGVSWTVLLPTVGLVGGFFVFVAGLVFRSRIRKPMTGQTGLIGEVGVVKAPIAPEGRIQVHGELWFARCRQPVAAGQRVRIIAIDGLTLEVEPVAGGSDS